MKKNQIDMSGTRIERLKVIMMDSKNKKQGVYWICKEALTREVNS